MITKISVYFVFAMTVVLLVGAPVNGQLPPRDRILGAVDASRATVVQGTAHPLARPELDRGRIDSGRVMSGAIVFRLSSAQNADLDRLLRDQQDASSASYHQWLTPEKYADRFGMTQRDLAKAQAWLKSQGLSVTGSSRGRTEVYFSGPAALVEAAFHTQIHKYTIRNEDHFANATALSVPQAMAEVVLGVRGLDDLHPKPMLRFRGRNSPSPRFTSDISGNHFLTPADFAVIYNVTALYNAGFDGTGIKIAVTGQSPLTAAGNATTDLDAFRSAAGLPAKEPTFVVVGAMPAFNSGEAVEADLDLEWSNAVAPKANVIFVLSGSAFNAIADIVNNNRAPIISNSFGLCESDLGAAQEQSLWQIVRQGNSQGQTMTSATGDTGGADCDGDQATTPTSASKGLSVDVPAAIPEVTGVGGTEFSGDSSQCTNQSCAPTTPCPNGFAPADLPFWASGCDLTSSAATAQEHIPEIAWNDTSNPNVAGELSAGGGGASIFFAKPSWQSGIGVPADGVRDVPDVALNASPVHDPYLICSQGLCVNGFRDPNSNPANNLDSVGGTSTGAPTFAGILALILQASGGTGLGNVNPMLYSLSASTPAAFHDVTSGDNKVPCTSGTKNCPAGTSTIGFSAGPGYDQATGLGSVDAGALESAWLSALGSPVADFTMEGESSTVVPGAQGSAVLNLDASNGFADTVNLTCSPSSQTAQISCSLSPASVALSAGAKTGSSTLSITTAASLERPEIPRMRGVWFAATGGLFAAVLVGGVSSRRRWMWLLGAALIAVAVTAVGCGGGGGSPQPKVQGTPAGTYVIAVTATGQNTGKVHTLNVSLTVQ